MQWKHITLRARAVLVSGALVVGFGCSKDEIDSSFTLGDAAASRPILDVGADASDVGEHPPSAEVGVPTATVEFVDAAITLALPHQIYEVPVEAHSAGGTALNPSELTWISSDESVVRVEEGVIWPLGEGTATVRAGFDDVFDEVPVRVLSVDSLSIVPTGGTLDLYDSPLELTLEYLAADGTPLSPVVPVEWQVSHPARAVVQANALQPLAPGPITVSAVSAGQVAVAEFTVTVPFVDVTCLGEQCCTLDTKGHGYCFGSNPFGSLGVDDDDDVAFPKPLIGSTRFESIHIGGWYACALNDAGAPYCWGWNAGGRLGYGEPDTGYPAFGANAEPKLVPTTASFVDLALGGSATYALTDGGELYAWGLHPIADALMPYPPPTHASPTLIDPGPWTSFAVGNGNVCGLKQGKLWCQGMNEYGQLGQGDVATVGRHFDEFVEYELPNAAAIVDVADGGHNMCVLDEFGEVWCSGLNIYGALGLPYEYPYHQDNRSHVPRRMNFGRTFDALIGNTRSTYCGITKDNLYCWGWNGSCQLGWDPGDDTSNPDHWTSHSHTLVHMDFIPENWKAITLSRSAGCLIDGDGELWCWGLSHTLGEPLSSGMNCDPALQRVLPYDD